MVGFDALGPRLGAWIQAVRASRQRLRGKPALALVNGQGGRLEDLALEADGDLSGGPRSHPPTQSLTVSLQVPRNTVGRDSIDASEPGAFSRLISMGRPLPNPLTSLSSIPIHQVGTSPPYRPTCVCLSGGNCNAPVR